ncbi:hypothetical protein IQ268_05150 [Oculatella sp. LEGE 06141]|uniref:DUF6130 family protein n=1 Tax=Oculatella sp. LEGE 06141 TaxID=1828648 RepID=UPI001880B0CE|nr:DUF6130 family protein [Oculatella sp. LEGE 06141]MBE9177970.1 hypothetical protein [Oculatella sp. LEGE 06141]
MKWQQTAVRGLLAVGLVLVLGLNLTGCGGDRSASAPSSRTSSSPQSLTGRLSEAAPAEVIQALKRELEVYQPQVNILAPKPNEVLQDDQVTVRFQVQDLPLFKDEELDLGPHLHVIVDNEPYRAVYNADEPLVLKDLPPGTHTIRAFASRPWHESFKNEGAYAQTTFHLFTQTPDNNPDPSKPLLTYSRPKGSYGAEPIMLDFYLTNAPLHLVAQERTDDDVLDWRIRATVNGESFVFDRWEPIYLKGFKPGKNWVQLELLDENGNLFPNPFNSTVRLIDYKPNGTDTLSKLIRGELAIADVRGIVDPTYTPDVEPIPEPSPTPTPEPIPVPVPSPEPLPTEPTLPEVEELPQKPISPPELAPVAPEEALPEPEIEEVPPPKSARPGLFDRFRRRPTPPIVEPAPVPTPPAIIESPGTPEETSPFGEAEPVPQEVPTIEDRPSDDAVVEPVPELEPSAPTPTVSPTPSAPRQGFFDRFRRRSVPPAVEPTSPPVPPAAIEPPTPESPPSEPLDEPDREDRASEDAVVEPVPELEPSAPAPPVAPTPSAPRQGFFDRFRRPATETLPSPQPLPDVLEAPDLDLPRVETTPETKATEPSSEFTGGFEPEPTPPDVDQIPERSPSPEALPSTPSKSAPSGIFPLRSPVSPGPLTPEDTLPEIIQPPASEEIEPYPSSTEPSKVDLSEITPSVGANAEVRSPD